MARGGQRGRRVNETLREIIAETITRDLSDPRLSMVTITDVRATEDLMEARVAWTVYDRSSREKAQRALESATGVIQGAIGRQLRAKHTPHLTFVFDEHLDAATSLTALIDQVTSDLPPADEDSRS